MDTQELTEIMGHNAVTRDSFHGVYARDTLPPLTVAGSYAVNTDLEAQVGAHWCAIWRNTELETETLECEVQFWDSLGKAPTDYQIRLSIAEHEPFRVVYQDSRTQASSSEVCGEHVCHFIYWRSAGASMTDIANQFTSNLKLNDDIVRTFKQNLLGSWM